ncbi:MAG TPA: DUF2383 domain-containing protein [Rhodanobacteraceae bacterium]|nr:DUF2383 domain-containing protein [Rhodanobacteraceae bacterium]
MKKDMAILSGLIVALDDAAPFYRAISLQATRPYLRCLLERVSYTHRVIAADLERQIVQAGIDLSRDGSFAGALRNLFASWRARASADIEEEYIRRVEASETRIRDLFRVATTRIEAADARALIRQHLNDIENCHISIGDLKESMSGPAPARMVYIADAPRTPERVGFIHASSDYSRLLDRRASWRGQMH